MSKVNGHKIKAYLGKNRSRDLLVTQRKDMKSIGLNCVLKTYKFNFFKTKHVHTKESEKNK